MTIRRYVKKIKNKNKLEGTKKKENFKLLYADKFSNQLFQKSNM